MLVSCKTYSVPYMTKVMNFNSSEVNWKCRNVSTSQQLQSLKKFCRRISLM